MDQAAPPPSSTTPTLLGKYQLGRLLGRGNFAKVYYARSLDTNTPVAIKAIDKSKATTSEPRIIREIAAMRRLHHHSNILKIHEVLATKTKIYLVMELAASGELFSKLLRRRKFAEPHARFYFQQLVSALHFCHQNGVAHRDLKPQNLLLDKDGNLKISDFGLSALVEQSKNGLLQTACGTPAYTAPEVVTRKGYDGAKADAWSCGIILFVMISGYLPFEDKSLPAMYKKIYQRDYKFPDRVSKQAKTLIYQLLDPNPKTRIGLEMVMSNPWFRKSLKSDYQSTSYMLNLVPEKDVKFEGMDKMNAFEIISLSSGLDLSRLFESGNRIEKKFTSAASAEKILEKVRETGGKLGYRVERGKGWNMGMRKGKVALLVEVLEIAEALRLVEVKVVDSGVEFQELCWEEMKSELQEVVLSWNNGGR